MKQYNSSLKEWWNFCQTKRYTVFEASANNVLEFLTDKFEAGASYGSLNTARAAISVILTRAVTNNDIISRFFRGLFRLRPTKPRYAITWDVDIVLDVLEKIPLENLNLQDLSERTVTILALATAHRLQTLALININNITRRNTRIEIKIPDLIKTSKPGTLQPLLVLPFFNERPNLCAARTLLKYIEVTKTLRGDKEKLFIGIKKPHQEISSQTIARWIKGTLKKCGINTDQFTAYSTRHASTSAAFQRGVDINTIRKTAGWSEQSNVFANFYNRPITSNQEVFNRAILNKRK